MINLYLIGEKGLITLKSIKSEYLSLLNCVIIGRDRNIKNDYNSDIRCFCESNKIDFLLQNKPIVNGSAEFSIAIGWRWLINDNSKLIVFHDSLLPRLRGFNPLVTALINGESEVGVTVLFGTENFDTGPIIIQKKINIDYPLKIKLAIERMGLLYAEAMNELLCQIKSGDLASTAQNESLATYSLWRDDDDYLIDWNKSAAHIKRFIDAVGYPYKGAFSRWNNVKYYINDAQIVDDVQIENRTTGKVLFKKDNSLIIVCGSGLLRVKDFFDEDGNIIEINNFRIRLS